MKIFSNLKLGIKMKLIVCFVSITVVSLLLTSGIVYTKVTIQTKNDYVKSVGKEITHIDSGISEYFSLIQENCKMFSTLPLIENTGSKVVSYVDKKGTNEVSEMTSLKNDPYEGEIYKLFENFAKSHPEISMLSMGSEENGGYIQFPSGNVKDGYDPRKRGWYSTAIKSPDKVNFTDIYTTTNGDATLTSVIAIKDSTNKIKGVLGLDVSLKMLSDMVKNTKIGESGYMIITDKNGNIIADPKHSNLISKNIKDLKIEKLNNITSVSEPFSVKLEDGKDYLATVQKSSNNSLGWNYIVFIEKSEFIKSANNIGLITLILFIIFTLISICITIFISNRISNPINILSKHLESIGSGDFSTELDSKYLDFKDEVGTISLATKKMQDSMKNILLEVQENSKQIKDKTHNLHLVAQGVSFSSGEVSTAIQDIAHGTSSQASELVNVTNILDNFSKSIEDIVTAVTEVTNNSKGINDLASDSNSKMQSLADSSVKVSRTFAEFGTKITNLNENIIKINDITNLINNVSEQTNLLALNAAIEAARAGESGRGFAVVADEVRKLAEKSKSSSEEIAALTSSIYSEARGIVTTSGEMDSEFNNQVSIIKIGIESFRSIVDAVEKVIPKIEEVSNSISSINKEKNIILSQIETSTGISEEMSGFSQEIAASSEEMNASAETVFTTVESLSEMSNKMMKQVSKFKL